MAGLDVALSLSGRRPLAMSATVGNRPAPRPITQLPPRRPGVPLMYANAQRAAATSQPPETKEAPRSLFEQFSDAVTGLPAGIVHLVGTGVQTAAAPIRMGMDVAKGDLSASDALGVAGTMLVPWQSEEWGDGKADKYLPLPQELATSLGQTALRARHPSRYLDAIKEGRILDVALEDAGNVALVGGAASKVLGAAGRVAEGAGMARTAGALETGSRVGRSVARFTNEFADAPVALPRKGFQALTRNVVQGHTFTPESLLVRSGLVDEGAHIPGLSDNETLRSKLPRQLTEEGRMGIRAVRRGDRTGNRLAVRAVQDLHRLETGNLDIEGAALAMLNQIGNVDNLVARQLSDDAGYHGMTGDGTYLSREALRQVLNTKDLPEHTFTPGAQQLVDQYLDGTIDPDVRAQIDRVMEGVQGKIGEVTDRALDAHGRLRGGLDPQQLGDDPIDAYMENDLRNVIGLDDDAMNAVAELRMEGYTWDDIAEVVPGVGELLNSPHVYPAAWRPAMLRAARAAEAGVPNIPLRPAGLLEAGVTRPTYLPGGETQIGNPKFRPAGAALVREGFDGTLGISSEQRRVNAEVQPYTLKAVAEKLSNEVRRTERNRALLDYADSLSDRVNTIIDQGTLDAIRQSADADAALMIRGDRAGQRRQARLLYAQRVTSELADRGYEVFQGDIDAPGPGEFKPGQNVDLNTFSDDALVLPAGVKDSLTVARVPKTLNMVVNALELGNSWWKSNVLPFSLRWQLGDVVGGQFMSWVGGGIPPWELVNTMRDMKALPDDLRAQIDQHVFDHPELVDSGLAAQEQQWVRGEEGFSNRTARTRGGRAYNRARQASFDLNQSINHANRHSYVLAKLQRLLDERGLDPLSELGADDARWQQPEVQRAITDAVNDANKVMGTFDELTPFEQRTLKNIFPFYVWTRHITTLAWRTALDNPARVLWTLRIGAMGNEDLGPVPDWLKGSIRVPDWMVPDFIAKGDPYLPLSWANPFNDIGGGSMLDRPTKNMSPFIKIPVAATTGINMSTDLPFTRPFGTGNYNDVTGSAERTPLWQRPGELGYVALSSLPLGRLALNIGPTMEAPGTEVGLGPHPRYQQGTFMVDSRSRPIDTTSRFTVLGQSLGIPMPTSQEDVDSIMATGEERLRARRNAQRNVRSGLPG